MVRIVPPHLRCLAASLGLLVGMYPGLVLAQAGPSSASAEPAPTPTPEVERGLFGRSGVGLATLTLPGLGQGGAGLLLEAAGGGRFTDAFSLRLNGAWGLTHFFRTAQAASLGLGLGAWTFGAYATVWEWMGTGNPEWAIFRLLGAFFGSVFLLLPLMVAGLLIVVSPLASTSFTEAAITAALHPLRGRGDLFLEAGMGLLAYAERGGSLRGGWGPLIGAGARLGPLTLRAHLIYSPDLMNESSGTGVLAGGISLGFSS
ncbi:MAG: hypothetical protein P1V51_14695 [Deltaproteobacteria bacterium]|nr:hypothetical protein [Deltaproteobacteria bacterium]